MTVEATAGKNMFCLTLMTMMMTEQAQGCDCWSANTVLEMVPVQGEELPSNATPIVRVVMPDLLSLPSEGTLETAGEAPTVVRAEPLPPSGGVVRLVPERALQEGATYTISFAGETWSFVAGPADTAPPGDLRISEVEPRVRAGGSCGPEATVQLREEPPSEEGIHLVELDVGAGETLAHAERVTQLSSEVWVGKLSECRTEFDTSAVHEGATVFLRGRLVDLSGNAGPWTEVHSVTLDSVAVLDDDAPAYQHSCPRPRRSPWR